MLQNGKLVARFVCVLVRRAALALCAVSCCARCGVFARCRLAVPASGWAGPQIGISYLVHPCTISGHLHAHLLAAPIWCGLFLWFLKIRRFESSLAKEAKLKETRRDGSRASVAAENP